MISEVISILDEKGLAVYLAVLEGLWKGVTHKCHTYNTISFVLLIQRALLRLEL